MIVGFRHKGLKRLFEKDDASGIRPDMVNKVRTILSQLNEAETIEDMRMTSFNLHPLKGDMKFAPIGGLFSALAVATQTMLNFWIITKVKERIQC